VRRQPRESPDAPPPPGNARTAALRLLGRRDYTVRELQEKLIARGHGVEDVTAVLNDLAADGLQSDERVAAAHVRTASQVKGRGRLRIARELEARGIGRPLVARVLATVAPGDERAAILEILRRKHFPASPAPAERRRMFQHLLRRGFSSDAIARALGRADDD
jgi:regulatory protein